ncbi:FGGY-family carbohydrate kinase [Qingshengfaniella alkalisoli]|uniref:Carbohydrate kinase n=1 Tax=Qingshengfaniella alkalisoli TaxID=2599296 RepID=A0A5B8IDD5_9RHOB|nr:FGGY-family carbohydrate kinase [Qingshengfaniella alkalisoli]QDY71696.1 carbohydrate kinase [Qingshengfaniella alkalisoli]
MPSIAVIDIGKTNLKVALVDPGTLRETEVRKRPNAVLSGPPYPHYDIDGHWSFIRSALRDLARSHDIQAISITTHGATAALVDAAGNLVLPILDYEFAIPDDIRADYATLRPAFTETGSPFLPLGLNIGTQLYWQFRKFPKAAAAHYILTYPQFWAMRLTGVAASEATSLGCHTDLWNPIAGAPSSLAKSEGWADLFPPLRKAADILGPLKPDLAADMGLPDDTPVLCGIHDSNASLYPHLSARDGAFSVVSTGTWVVSMAVGSKPVTLDPARDTLINVDAHGQPVPSARFMGGREFELTKDDALADPTTEDRAQVLTKGLFLLPSVVTGCGPYPDHSARWVGASDIAGQRVVALSYYLALMTAQCLDMIGADGPTLVEGPFAANEDYLSMLASATGRGAMAVEGSSTGTSTGAAMLALSPGTSAPIQMRSAQPDPSLARYADHWRAELAKD